MAGNFYYVDNQENTGTGNSYATSQSGLSYATLGATNCYGSIELAITDGASDDDDIICAVEHAFVSSTVNITIIGGTSKALRISCATTADCGVKGTGASETTINAYDIIFNKLTRIIDVDFDCGDLFYINISGNATSISNGSIDIRGVNNSISVLNDNCYLELNNVITNFDQNTSEFTVNNGGTLVLNGGSVISTLTTTVDHLTDLTSFTAAGGHLYATGVNLSAIIGTLIKNVGGDASNDDSMNIHIDKCTLNASVDFNNETLKGKNHKILITQSGSDSASAEYQHYFSTRGGTIEQATNIWRDESEPYYLSNQKVSWHAITNSDAEVALPFTFDFNTRKAALSGVAATDVVRIYLAVVDTVTLYDNDVFAKLVYPDGTTKNVFHSINSLATPSDNPQDIFRTPAVLPTDTVSNWKDSGGDLTGYNEYYMDLDTSADVGADCVPKIVMHVAKELAAGIYFDTSLGVVSS